ncbi:MAG: SDR family NAD(P)-dependent oxidoreductase, partial [Gammaproteobacteria bacterium]|nr:SDR family NAD(P)-dependent oxidoreductase [Gammaproteobacteria bacterium]
MSICFDLDGKTALVTGASAGLGAHFAATLSRAGARVILAARRTNALHQIAARIRDAAGEAYVVTMDVCERASVEAAIDEAESRFSPVDILVNNAGVAQPQRFLEMSEAAWRSVIDTDLSSVWRVSQVVANRMMARGSGGSIVNIASVLGLVVQSTHSNYASAKAGVIHLTKSLAVELWRHGVRVNAIAPGYFITAMNRDFFSSEAGQAYRKRLFPRRTGELHALDGAL